ncbi:MAG: hypothetical protein IT428_26400 [Planctomycetaceae bacterium]|nr:hypothetical protein [Planctomycetaceae bacterium]
MSRLALVRYGAIPEVARFDIATEAPLVRGDAVVVRTHRGVQLGTYLEELTVVSSPSRVLPAGRGDDVTAGGEVVDEGHPSTQVLRPATPEDVELRRTLQSSCESDFAEWVERIRRWNLKLELIDLERTLDDEKLILYVLNERGPECTKLAIQAAAAGLGIIEVQPVGLEGLLKVESGGGCGSGGCGSGGCHS